MKWRESYKIKQNKTDFYLKVLMNLKLLVYKLRCLTKNWES